MTAPSPFKWGAGGARLTPEDIAQERKIAAALMQQGGDFSPVQHWTQGAARVAQAMMGGIGYRKADEAARANQEYDEGVLNSFIPGGGQGMNVPPQAAAPAPPTSPAWPGEDVAAATPGGGAREMAWPGDRPAGGYGDAIAKIESGGRYDALGPVTRTGDRAFGKYQVMGANIPSWTEAALGRRMTPQEFLANPQAQDAVFQHRFGQYATKYGPEGAAKAWFAGEGGMKNPNARDQLGTTVSAYAQKFMKNLGPDPSQQPYQVASLGGPVAGPTVGAPPQGMPAFSPQEQEQLSQFEPTWQEAAAFPAFAPPRQAQQPQGVARVAQAMQPGTGGPDPRLLRAIADPRVSDGTKKVLGIMLQQQMQGQERKTVDLGSEVGVMDRTGNIVQRIPKVSEPTSGIKEYEYSQRDPAFRQHQIDMKKAGAQSISIDQRGESEYDKATGKHFAEINAELPKAAISARTKLSTLDRLGALLSDPKVTQGAGANAILEAKRIAKQIGFDVEGVEGAEAIRAIGNQFALELRNPSGGAGMPGALSDKDREFLQASVPGLQQSPGGNKLIVDYMKRVAQRSLDVERLRQDYVRKNRRLDEGFYTALADYSDKNSLFPEAEKGGLPQAAPAAPAAAPDRGAIEQEMRRRGLIK